MFLNAKQIKKYFHDHNKQISKEGMEALNCKFELLLASTIRNTGHFKRITATEVNFAGYKQNT